MLFPLHLFYRQVCSCCHNLLTVIQSYNSKNTPSGKLYVVKIAEAVLLYVFTKVFPTSVLTYLIAFFFPKNEVRIIFPSQIGNFTPNNLCCCELLCFRGASNQTFNKNHEKLVLRRNKPVSQAARCAQTFPDATPPIDNIHPFSKIVITFEPRM